MKLTLHLMDGTTAKGYVSNGMLGELETAIITQRGYKDTSEIPDEDRVKIIVNSNGYLNVFDADYRFDDIQSYEIDNSELTEEEETALDLQRRSFEWEAHQFALTFFGYYLGQVFPKEEFGRDFDPRFHLPITFWTHGDFFENHGGYTVADEKNASINILLDGVSFSDRLRKAVMHEILHYALWYVDLPFGDDDVEFWCLGKALDAFPYDHPEDSKKRYFDAFMNFYNGHLQGLPDEILLPMLGKAVAAISKSNRPKEYKDTLNVLVGEIENLKKQFG